MTRAEWLEVVAEMRTRWPHAAIPKPTMALWFEDLQDLPVEQIRTAVGALYLDGREFPPNSGQIRAKVVELDRDDVDHSEAWRLARKASRKSDPKEGRAWLAERCPMAVTVVDRLTGWPLSYRLEDEPTVRAQFRRAFEAEVARQERDARYAVLPSAGLRQLERRGNPQRIGTGVLKALPGGQG